MKNVLACLVVAACGGSEPPVSHVTAATPSDAGVTAPDAVVFASLTGMGPDAPTPSTETVDGDLDKATIKRVIKSHDPQFRACYEQQLAMKPMLEGTVHIRFVIGRNGLVQEASAHGVDGTVSGCVSEEIMKLAFPRSARPMTVTDYPIKFAKT